MILARLPELAQAEISHPVKVLQETVCYLNKMFSVNKWSFRRKPKGKCTEFISSYRSSSNHAHPNSARCLHCCRGGGKSFSATLKEKEDVSWKELEVLFVFNANWFVINRSLALSLHTSLLNKNLSLSWCIIQVRKPQMATKCFSHWKPRVQMNSINVLENPSLHHSQCKSNTSCEVSVAV